MKFENFGQVYGDKSMNTKGGISVDSASGTNITIRQESSSQEDGIDNDRTFKFIDALEDLGEEINNDLGEITEENYSERIKSLKNIHSKYKQNLEEFADVMQNNKEDYIYVLKEQMEVINKKILEYKTFKENYNKKKEILDLENNDNYVSDSYIEKSEYIKGDDSEQAKDNELSNFVEVATKSDEKQSYEKNIENKGKIIDELSYLEKKKLSDRRKKLKEEIDVHVVYYEQVLQVGTEEEKNKYFEKRNELKQELKQINEELGITEIEERLEDSLEQLDMARVEFAQKKVLSDKMKGFFSSEPGGEIANEVGEARIKYIDSQKKYVDEFMESKEINGKVDVEVAKELFRFIKMKEFAKLDFEENKVKFHDRKKSFGKFMNGKMTVALSLKMREVYDFFNFKNKEIEEMKQKSDVLDMTQDIRDEAKENVSGKNMIDSSIVKNIIFNENESIENVQEVLYFKAKSKDKKNSIKSKEILKEEILQDRHKKLEQELELKTKSVWKSIKDKYGIDQKIHDAKVKIEMTFENLLNTRKSNKNAMRQMLDTDQNELTRYNKLFRTLLDTEIGGGKRIVLENMLVTDIEESKVINLPEKDVKKFQRTKLLIGGVLHESSNALTNETLEKYSKRVVEEMYNKCVKNGNCNDTEFENFSRIFDSNSIA